MNQQQVKYLVARIESVKRQKLNKIEQDIKVPDERLTFKQKYELIKSGVARLKPYESLQTYTDLADAYSYPEDKEKKQAVVVAKAKQDKAIAKVVTEAGKLLDEIMLGDAEQALQKLNQFKKSV